MSFWGRLVFWAHTDVLGHTWSYALGDIRCSCGRFFEVS